jgi:hypothetical protein
MRKEKLMSNSTEQKTGKTGRIHVGKLSQQEKQLKKQEAENVKGGGGLAGGVVPTNPSEQIAQTSK